MKQTITILALGAFVAAPLVAQNNNRVWRNNQPYLVISTAKHTTTQKSYAYPPTTPSGYDIANVATGVAAGTRKFRVITDRAHKRLEAHEFSGVTYIGKSAAAMAAAQNTQGYFPKTELRGTVARTGGGLDPDLAGAALATIPNATSAAPPGDTFRQTTTVAPVNLNWTDVALTMEYVGGENDDKDPNVAMAPSQCNASSWQDGPTPFVTDGHIDPMGAFLYNTDPTFIMWATILEEGAALAPYSNWGQRRIAPLTPPLRGHSLGTEYSDLVSNATGPWAFGLDINGGPSNAGNIAVPLMNAGPIWNVPIPFQGQTLEMNPGDSALAFLIGIPGLVAVLGTNGDYAGPELMLPRLPGASGSNLGFEYVILNAGTLMLDDSTGAAWVELN